MVLFLLLALPLAFGFPGAPSRPGVFPAASAGVCTEPAWSVDGDQLDGRFGTVAPAGDVNGDGWDDVIVGAYNYDHPEVDEGAVWLFLGSPSGLSTSPAWMGESNQAGAKFGDKLSGAGDVNGDGYDDVVIGSATYDVGSELDAGAAFLYLGGPGGLSSTPDWWAGGDQENANFGACAQPAGDVNADGYSDVILGAWLDDHPEVDEGRAFVYLGSDSGLSDTPVWTGEGNSADAVYGYFCTAAGDVNGDGFGDIVVGARRWSGAGISKEGRAYVYHGSAAGPSAAANWVRSGGQAGGEFGNSPAGAGDVNGDGYDDLLVNAFRFDHGQKDEGMAFLFLGSSAGLATAPAWSAEGDEAFAYFGYHVDAAGDLNADGYGDVIVTAADKDVPGFVDAGWAGVWLGSASGLQAAPDWTQSCDQVGAGLGNAARGAGDVDGDGFDDVLTGALYRDGPPADAGRAYLFYGCPEGPVAVTPPRAPEALRLAVLGAHPFRDEVRLALTLPESGIARVTIHDAAGRRVATLLDGRVGPGTRELAWRLPARRNGVPTAAGVYFARAWTPAGSRAIRLVRLP